MSPFQRIRISIHSLAWRKTDISKVVHKSKKISIHSLAWRKTVLPVMVGFIAIHFNPLSRMEKDCYSQRLTCCFENFNPLSRMEKDMDAVVRSLNLKRFQSTLSHGERRDIDISSLPDSEFQSTLSHGERHSSSYLYAIECHFNPLSRMEKDVYSR